MCILLYVKLIWCSGFPEIYAWLGRGVGSATIGICSFLYTRNLFGVEVFLRSYSIGGGGCVSLPLVYVHSSICETYLV